MSTGTLTMHVDLDGDTVTRYVLTCSCGAHSKYALVTARMSREEDESAQAEAQRSLVDGWGSEHRCPEVAQ